MNTRDDDKEKQEKQQQSGSGSGRPATKFMERPKQGQKQGQQQPSSGIPSEEEDIEEGGESQNLKEDADEGRSGQDFGSQQQQKKKDQGQQGQQKPGDN